VTRRLLACNPNFARKPNLEFSAKNRFCKKGKRPPKKKPPNFSAKTDFATKFGIQVICKQKSASDPKKKNTKPLPQRDKLFLSTNVFFIVANFCNLSSTHKKKTFYKNYNRNISL
jgi:hypothetical protein